MPHVIERASSGRAKCRACNRPIAKDELRFGERHPNAFGEGEMTLWFHLQCGAYTRPEPFLETLPSATVDAADLAVAAQFGIAHRRVPRVHGAERASTGRARCRNCRELIPQGEWRIPLIFFEEFRFAPSGFVHARCAQAYFETTEVLDRVRHFNPDLSEDDIDELEQALRSTPLHPIT
jgi:poly(ADP-ribose) polymerase-like protein